MAKFYSKPSNNNQKDKRTTLSIKSVVKSTKSIEKNLKSVFDSWSSQSLDSAKKKPKFCKT